MSRNIQRSKSRQSSLIVDLRWRTRSVLNLYDDDGERRKLVRWIRRIPVTFDLELQNKSGSEETNQVGVCCSSRSMPKVVIVTLQLLQL